MTAPASCAGRFPLATWSWWLTRVPKRMPNRSRDSIASTARRIFISTANAGMTMVITSRRAIWCFCSFAGLGALFAAGLVTAEPALFQSKQIARSGEYTFGIEGPAVDRDGNLYVVNFQKAGTIGRLKPRAAASELFLTLPEGSIGNSIRFARDGRMFIADYKKHNIFVAAPGSTTVSTYFHSDQFNQPNDITIADDGTIYASDPNWKRRDGRVWKISRGADGTVTGEIMTSPRNMSTTNGLDLNSDGTTLY